MRTDLLKSMWGCQTYIRAQPIIFTSIYIKPDVKNQDVYVIMYVICKYNVFVFVSGVLKRCASTQML